MTRRPDLLVSATWLLIIPVSAALWIVLGWLAASFAVGVETAIKALVGFAMWVGGV